MLPLMYGWVLGWSINIVIYLQDKEAVSPGYYFLRSSLMWCLDPVKSLQDPITCYSQAQTFLSFLQ